MSTIVRASPSTVGARRVAVERVATANDASEHFFVSNAEQIARACQAMAARFQGGGRLVAVGDAAQRSDVAHVVVEFVHPVIVGKRALPALALQASSSDGDALRALDTVGRSVDMLLAFTAAPCDIVARLLAHARGKGMLTLALTGAASDSAVPAWPADFHFAVPSHDPCIVQETHEMLYHMLWELVHVFFEHRSVSV